MYIRLENLEDTTENSQKPEFSENSVYIRKNIEDLVFLPIDSYSKVLLGKLIN